MLDSVGRRVVETLFASSECFSRRSLLISGGKVVTLDQADIIYAQ